jgi:RNA polymerase sigma-70 factor (ECF subfamily)
MTDLETRHTDNPRAAMTDRELLLAYAESSDTESLGAFVQRYQSSLVRFAGKLLCDPEAAQDVVQETFLQVARHPRRLLDVHSCHNWLLRVTRNIGVSRIRKEARLRKHTEALRERTRLQAAEKAPSASRILEAEELRATVRSEINRLNPRYREVLLLKVQEEKSYREIAEITGLTVTNVGYLLHQAMKQLSSRLRTAREVLP